MLVARRAVLARLDGRLTERLAIDVGLIVSELVTNSVRHAGAGPQAMIRIELVVGEVLRVVVIDDGSSLMPRIAESGQEVPGGMGLVLVDRVSLGWGVLRDADGCTSVWCELAW